MKAALTPDEQLTLTQAIASGQVSPDQIEAHRAAGDLPIVMFEPQTVTDDALDAERYRFLRAQPINGEPGQPVIAVPNGMRSGYYMNEENADFAVDAAIKATS